MPTVREIESRLFQLAPRERAMDWDNVGQLLGDPEQAVGERLCGVKLLRDPLWDRYLIEKILQLQEVVAGRNRSTDPLSRADADRQRELITELLVMREEWRHANRAGN